MTHPDHPTFKSLQKGQLLRLARPLGCRIECTRGAVWLTHDRSVQDMELAAGEDVVVRTQERLIIQALEPSCIRLGQTRGWDTPTASVRAAAALIAVAITAAILGAQFGLASQYMRDAESQLATSRLAPVALKVIVPHAAGKVRS